MSGFLFPAFNDNSARCKSYSLLYWVKPNQPDVTFIEEVLNCEDIITAEEDKEIFDLVIKKVAWETKSIPRSCPMSMRKLIELFKKIKKMKKVKPPKLDKYRDIEKILTVSGVENVDTAESGACLSKPSLRMSNSVTV